MGHPTRAGGAKVGAGEEGDKSHQVIREKTPESHREGLPDDSSGGKTAVRHEEEFPGPDSGRETSGEPKDIHVTVSADSLKRDRKRTSGVSEDSNPVCGCLPNTKDGHRTGRDSLTLPGHFHLQEPL